MIKTAEEIFNDILWPEKGLDTYFKMMRRLSIKAMEAYHAQFTQPQKVDSGNVWRWVKCSERLPENENNVLINHNERYQRAYYRDKWFVAGTNVVAAYEHQSPQIEWLEPLPQGEGYSVEDVIEWTDWLGEMGWYRNKQGKWEHDNETGMFMSTTELINHYFIHSLKQKDTPC